VKLSYIRYRLRELLKFNEPPHKLALAFAVGTFISFSPWLGLHIASAVLFAVVFRLNKVVVVTASLINNPWTIVPVYAFCLWFGVKITGSDMYIPQIDWRGLDFSDLFFVLKPFLLPYVAGTLVVGSAAGVAAYYLFFWAVRKYRKEEAAAAAMTKTPSDMPK
jgi:uncharacterized protein (DUF2062 family)